jgi:hypothetical protein
MPKGEEIELHIDGGGKETVKLKTFTVQQWQDILADLKRVLPDFKNDGSLSQGFKYKGAFGREKIVHDQDSLKSFFKHAIEESEFSQSVVLVAAEVAAEPAAEVAAKPAAALSQTTITPTQTAAIDGAGRGAVVVAKTDSVNAAAIEFPASAQGEALFQVRPVVSWGKESISVSLFVCCKQFSAKNETPCHFLFSYSKRGSTVLDFGLSTPTALKAHLKGDVIETGVALDANQWKHVVLAWSSRDGTLTLYVDGSKVFSSSKLRTGAEIVQGGAFILGNTPEGKMHAFVGIMSEVSVWKTALDREFVRKMSQKPVLKGSEESLCLYFDFKSTTEEDSAMILDVISERPGQLFGGASLFKKPITIVGRVDESRNKSGGGGGVMSFALRFEERAFGRLVTNPPLHTGTALPAYCSFKSM